jgi:hypothetical protein
MSRKLAKSTRGFSSRTFKIPAGVAKLCAFGRN